MWTPVVGQVFKGYKFDHGPGAKFVPDGTGGGTLTFQHVEVRKGFRPKTVTRTIRKTAHHG